MKGIYIYGDAPEFWATKNFFLRQTQGVRCFWLNIPRTQIWARGFFLKTNPLSFLVSNIQNCSFSVVMLNMLSQAESPSEEKGLVQLSC